MKDRRFILLAALLVALVLMLGSLFSMQQGAQAGPLAVPTPVGKQAGGGDWIMITYSTSGFNGFTTTQTSGSKHAPRYTAADVSWTIDVTDPQTVTCKMQFSNDNSNWADGLDMFAALSADATNITQTQLFGRWHRITCTETGTNPVTVTLKAKLMN